ncbi:MAG: hypothetical protein ACRENL_01415 [Candidatus Dormibacteria bacterium]
MLVLVAQFLLGTAVNLFVKIPADHPGAHSSAYFSGLLQSVTWAVLHGWVLLSLHAILGLILLVGSIAVLVTAVRQRARRHIVVGALGVMGVIAAGFNGGSFLVFGEDYSSYLMAVGFAVAVLAYTTGLFISCASPTHGHDMR